MKPFPRKKYLGRKIQVISIEKKNTLKNTKSWQIQKVVIQLNENHESRSWMTTSDHEMVKQKSGGRNSDKALLYTLV